MASSFVTLLCVKSSSGPDRGGDQPSTPEPRKPELEATQSQLSASKSSIKSIKPKSPKSSSWMKHAGLGIELAGTTIGVAAIGYAIDWKMQNATPYATAFLALLGFSFAMFRFIQNVTRENR